MTLLELATTDEFRNATLLWSFVTIIIIGATSIPASSLVGSCKMTFKGSTILAYALFATAILAGLFQLALYALALWAPVFV